MCAIAVLVLAGCGERSTGNEASGSDSPSATESSSAPSEQFADFKACMVSDSGGFDDKSFNQTSHDGLVQAQ